MIKVTYLGHSGFLVELEEANLLFDFYRGELPQIDTKKPLVVFVSHSHYDHYNKEIFSLREYFPSLWFVLSSEVFTRETEHVLMVRPNETLEAGGCLIRTLRSTDEGVAYLVSVGGRTVFHAGDLNWWHWEGESKEYNTAMRRAFQREINKLQGEWIDLAFFPADPRLGKHYLLGLDCFMKRTGTKLLFPMHFWEDYTIFDRIAQEECAAEYLEHIVRIDREGQSFLLEEEEENGICE